MSKDKLVFGKLLRFSLYLLDNEFTTSKKEEVLEVFSSNLIDFMRDTILINLKAEDIKIFTANLERYPKAEEFEILIENVLDKDSSFAVINRFLIEFVLLYIKNSKKEFLNEIYSASMYYQFEDNLISSTNTRFISALNA